MKCDLQDPQVIFWIAIFAIIGQIFLVASSFLLPSVSQFDVLHDRISELALGRFGFIETMAFCISGMGTVLLAVSIRKITSHLPGSILGSLFIGIYGVGGIIVAVFPTDRVDVVTGFVSRTETGSIHLAAAVLSFVCVTIGMFILAETFRKTMHFRAFGAWKWICPSIAFALLFAQFDSPLAGLTERLFIFVVAVWIVLLANEIRKMSSSKIRTSI